MVSVVFLLIGVFATSEATLLHCSSSGGTGSGDIDDLEQVTTLQYCVVDNCTIMRIDTGQKLDIVYTTESIIVINATDGQTSSAIAKDDNQLPCFVNNPTTRIIGPMIITTLTTVVSGYILIVHLLFKELHNLMGKLTISYNIMVVSQCLIISIWLLLHYIVAINSQTTCHIIAILFIITALGYNMYTYSYY